MISGAKLWNGIEKKKHNEYKLTGSLLNSNFKDMTQIPVHVVSGFLGSGKTTFLKEILSQLPLDLKAGIIQNEFAPLNLDGKELQGTGRDFYLLEVNNGSLFCVCLLGDFRKSLAAFVETHSPDLLVLEASGLSDTTSIAEIFADPLLAGKIYLAANWCIVDAFHFRKAGKMEQRVHQQIRMADLLLVNKTDLAGDAVPGIVELIREANPFAEIHTTTFCKVPFQMSRVPLTRYYREAPEAGGRPEIRSMVLKSSRKISSPGLVQFLERWAPEAYRIKGYAATHDKGLLAVQCTMGQIDIREVKYPSQITELIALTDQFSLHGWNRSFRQHLGEQ